MSDESEGVWITPRKVSRPGKPTPKPKKKAAKKKATNSAIPFRSVETPFFEAIILPPVQQRPTPVKRKAKPKRESKREKRDRKIAEATAEPPVVFEVRAEDIMQGDLIAGMPSGRRVKSVAVDYEAGIVTIEHEGRPRSENLVLALGSPWLVRRDK